MKEYPVFVPTGGERISAVITVPDGEPRGLVMLLPGGGGATRSHRYALYTTVARALADRGVASVRMDWKGVGDSTGKVRYSFKALPSDEAVAVARFAMTATGATAFGMAGNCGGARTTLLVVPRIPEARAAVLMMMKPLTGVRNRQEGVRKLKRAVRRVPRIGPTLRRAYWALRWRKANPVFDQIREIPETTDLLFLEAVTVKAGKLPQFVAGLQEKNGHRRLELRELPGGSTRAFHSLERQDFVTEALVEWFDNVFPPATPSPVVRSRVGDIA
jgi:alpha/beta superfamily hydrolase